MRVLLACLMTLLLTPVALAEPEDAFPGETAEERQCLLEPTWVASAVCFVEERAGRYTDPFFKVVAR